MYPKYSAGDHRPATATLYRAVTDHFRAFRDARRSEVQFISQVTGEVIDPYKVHRTKLRQAMIKITQQAGIENLTKLHTLCHTFASHLVMSGVNLPTVTKLMGHSDIQTTMIYAHLTVHVMEH